MIVIRIKSIHIIQILINFTIIALVRSKALIGDFQFVNEFDTSLVKTWKLENAIGNFKYSVIPFFTEMCPAVNTKYNWFTTVTIRNHLNNIWNASAVPIMTWQPSCYQPELPSLSNISNSYKVRDTFIREIGQGLHDDYLKNVASELKLFLSGSDGIYGNDDDRRVYVRLGHEMNGNWYQWSVAKNKYITTADYKSMWVRTRLVFSKVLNSTVANNAITSVDQSTRIQFIWNPNNFDTGGVKAEDYYPGDAYVDFLGMDVYNFLYNGGQSHLASVLMTPMIQRFQALSSSKPIAVPEFGCQYVSSNGVTYTGKWYADFFATAQKYGLRMLSQFNIGSNAVYGSTTQPNIPMYIDIMRNSTNWLVQGNPKMKRLISDEDFKGSISSVQVTVKPSSVPSTGPTYKPTTKSTYKPSVAPTYKPSVTPTNKPSIAPTYKPSVAPTHKPSVAPTHKSSVSPTNKLSIAPTYKPSVSPTYRPSTKATSKVSVSPTYIATVPFTSKLTFKPTTKPSATSTYKPSGAPTYKSSVTPTKSPTLKPLTLSIKATHSVKSTTIQLRGSY